MKTPLIELDEREPFIRAYEEAWRRQAVPELTDFLPEGASPLFASVLRELVRVDLEWRWQRGCPRRLREYQQTYPALFRDAAAAAEIAYEEYRVRLQAGEQPDPDEYAKQYGIDTSDWFRPGGLDSGAAEMGAEGEHHLETTQRFDVADVEIYRSFLAGGRDAQEQGNVRPTAGGDAAGEHGRLLRELSAVSPGRARRLAEAMTDFPEPGTSFCSFHLLAELGRGAFARVYLARQGELADRLVAVKVAPEVFHEESQTLARLQHTNIVPIYSTHRARPFVAVCMPYFGATTLADVIRALRSRKGLPVSGRELATTLEDSFKLSVTTLASGLHAEAVKEGAAAAPRPEPAARPAAPLQQWERLPYVEAVLWIAARLVEGLRHAHERGILHRDLKPANVLLTDEGEPMLLDFNLADNLRPGGTATTACLGGTLPYMAPECLQALLTRSPRADARSDLYAVGILLYELLARRHPFPVRRGSAREAAPLLLQDRRSIPVSPRRWNRAVSPAAAAIVLKCLHPDPARRYQSAGQLLEDLQRQRQHRPLRHAPDRSPRERAAKWVRRHPRLASSTTVAFAAGLLLAGLLALMLLQGRHQARLQARADLGQLNRAMQSIPFLLARPDAEAGQRAEGVALCREQADRFGLLTEADWRQSAQVSALDDAGRDELRQGMGELLWFWARALAWDLPSLTEDAGRRDRLELCLRLNALALGCYADGQAPATHLRQRARLSELAGDHETCRQLLAESEARPPRSPREYYLALCEQVGDGYAQQALPFLQQATLKGPGNGALWLILGNCQAEVGDLAAAKACFDHGLALDPDSPWAWFNRGVVQMQQENFAAAKEDFTRAVRLRATMVEALMNRAVAEIKLGQPEAAVNDLDRALELKAAYTRIYFIRAEAKLLLKDEAGARKDREHGLRLEPSDELSWVARGIHRLKLAERATPEAIQGALADFDKALKLNPRSASALENKAAILSGYLQRDEEAVQVLDRAVKALPHVAAFRAGRGVLLARRGRRTEAHQDAVKALALSQRPEVCYQVAGIYALTSVTEPEDRKEALRLLQKAFAGDSKLLDLVPVDQDLNPIRDRADFRELLELSKKLRRP